MAADLAALTDHRTAVGQDSLRTPPRPAFTYRYFGLYRFVLAALVMLHHFTANAAPVQFTLAVEQYEFGSVAVLAFFCLSGLVIAEAVDMIYKDRAAAFIGNQLLRIMPHFVIATALMIALTAIFMAMATIHVSRFGPPPAAEIFSPKNIAANFAAILPVSDRYQSYQFLNIVWAVRVEMAFYVFMFGCLLVAHHVIPRNRSGVWLVATAGLILVGAPAFALSVLHKLPGILGYAPYFSFGAGLYFAWQRTRIGLLVTLASVPAMIWHFLSQPAVHPDLGFQRAVGSQLVLLIILIGAMMALAVCQFPRIRRIDRYLGNATFPLYMYHIVLLLCVTSLFPEYSYTVFIGGMGLAIALSVAMMRLVDPLVDRYRDRLRGRKVTA